MSALTGVRVVCLGQFYLAPYCSMLLARLGADVIKVEAPNGDPYRRVPTSTDPDAAVQYTLVNSGKRNIRVDLKQPAGQDLVRRLAERADVLVQNLAPGAVERYGLDYETLHALNPKLIVASGTGFGSFGPYSGEPAMDLTIQARTAVMSTTGFIDGTPVRTGPSVVDFMAGSHLAAGVLAALFQRSQTGVGQHVEVALQDAILPSLASNIAGYLSSGGSMPERTGNRHGGLAVVPYNAYATSDGWVTLLCPTDGHWQRLCEVMQDDDARADRFATMAGRVTHVDDVDEIVGRWTKSRTKAEICAVLKSANVPVAPVVGLGELLEDEHVHERGVLRKIDDDRGTWWAFGSPVFLSDSPVSQPARPGKLGEHNDAVLAEELGLSATEIADLRESGVI